ncbi:nicotinate-nucleotide--dimethylbenzimidazole phosphoribosyltransferase [Streptomyces sp. NBC_01142]|uniref:nicotinate-nucleotide--dimethylbenzimidazole phosphoribosyltransferase n=1 Tax=Streptomyces sp. NBC_01142 TaxID=2975865 RepID=UPI002253A9D4|nr:nicotinate-nucleotide--dimethylbenzimidazole phosphoribosyltransferase [Streptomyces sp. NBC_01142]MCX4821806.1 nicotinate-nucleotide--dimethylbenzimidazole phosphoribosyltransferase [Streptomyces sp. NBC_01142]
MTDTGQIPGEGLPEDAGMVEQPGSPAPGAYTFLDPSENGPEDDLLLMPGAQGAWSDPQPVQPGGVAQGSVAQTAPGAVPVSEFRVDVPAVAMPMPVQVPAQMPIDRSPVAEHHIAEHQIAEHHAGEHQVAAPAPVQMPVGPDAAPEFVTPEFVAPDFATAPAPAPLVEPVAPAFAETHFAQSEVSVSVAESSVSASAAQAAPVEPVAGTSPATEQSAPAYAGQAAVQGETAYADPVHETGAHEAGGRDSGHVDLSGVRNPPSSATPTPPPARRPLHMGPPMPDSSGGVVRSLADRGPAGAPAQAMPVRSPGPATAGLEYLDVPREETAAALPGPQLGEIPPQAGEPWNPQPPQSHTPPPAPAETVVPEPAPVFAEVSAPVPAPAPTSAGEFVPVDGSLPSTPHLAPTPVAVMVQPEPEPELAPEPVPVSEDVPELEPEAVAEATVPAPREEVEVSEIVTVEVAEEPAPEPVEPETAPQLEVEPEPEAVLEAEVAPVSEPEPEPEPVPEAEVAPVPEPEPAPVPEAEQAEPEQAEPAPEPEQAEPVLEPSAESAAEPQPAPEPTPVGGGTPPAPGYDDVDREAVLRVMRERRDIRNGFRSDPIPHEVLLRVLEAAHTAPSVGHSQPWDFVVIRSAETRRTMHELAQRQREAYAKSLPKGRAKQFKELKIEAILDTPVNIVVTADPTRGGRHTLGRHTQPQMAPYSSALAVENLWLAARAEGLGVGWVSFFDEREMVRALGLPEHLEVVAYLCVGYVDEFPEEPELLQAGWSKRRPLSWVVHEETYGRRALPGEEPHDLLQETVTNIRPLDAKALGEAWERQKRMTKPAGALGMLEIISAQLSGLSRLCPPPIPEPAAVAIFAGDHGVHAQGVTSWPQEVTAQMVANFLGGGAVCNAFANQVGAEVCVIDVGVAGDLPATPGLLPRKVRPGTADFTTGPALTREEVHTAIEVGIETARDLVAAGNKALLTGEMGIANTTVSAALISVYTGIDPSEITGRGTGINDEMHARKVDVVRRALDLHAPDPADPIGVLSAVGGLEHAALVGFILGGASLRTPVVLDGVSAGAAALVARAIAHEALAACIAGHRSAEPGHVAALNKLGLRPLVDLDLRLGEGTGALLALPVIQSAARAMHEVATFDSAGVTEK